MTSLSGADTTESCENSTRSRGKALVCPGCARINKVDNRTIGWGSPPRPSKEASMPDEPKPAGRSYQMGDVGAGARVIQGEGNTWIEGVAKLPEGDSLTLQFNALLERIAKDASLDEDTRALAQDKTKAVAEGLAKAPVSPGMLRRALLDAKSWFGSTASWAGNALGDILKSEAAQKTIGTVTEAATKAAITSFVN